MIVGATKHPSLTLRLAPQCTAELGAVWYWRESTGDGVYDNGGNLLRGSDGSAERFVGTQLDASLAFELHRSCDVTIAWSTFLPGAFLQDTGAAERVHFFAAEVCFVF